MAAHRGDIAGWPSQLRHEVMPPPISALKAPGPITQPAIGRCPPSCGGSTKVVCLSWSWPAFQVTRAFSMPRPRSAASRGTRRSRGVAAP